MEGYPIPAEFRTRHRQDAADREHERRAKLLQEQEASLRRRWLALQDEEERLRAWRAGLWLYSAALVVATVIVIAGCHAALPR